MFSGDAFSLGLYACNLIEEVCGFYSGSPPWCLFVVLQILESLFF